MIASCLLLAGCQIYPQPVLSLPGVERAPLQIDDGWLVAAPASQGVDPATLLELYRQVERGEHTGVDAIVVARHGRLVSERYFGVRDLGSRHETRSTFKSVTALIVGIAVDQGIVRLDDPVAPLLARYHELRDPDIRKRRITFRHLLEMRSGLDCSEMPGRRPYREDGASKVWDWVAYNWEIPMAGEPGAEWRYCSSNSFLLGVALSAALQPKVGMDVRGYADRELFRPLQVTSYRVNRTPDGHMTTQGNGFFRPRDLAKFGQLILDRGRWQGRQLVSARWIGMMTDAQAATDWSWTRDLEGYSGTEVDAEYGYQWFRTRLTSNGRDYLVVHSWGNGGQFVFVVPEFALVTVVTGSSYGFEHIERQRHALDILARFVIPASIP